MCVCVWKNVLNNVINYYFRLILLEALNQLCATKAAREVLRQKNTYVILREFHKWEKDKNVLLACENVVDILIKLVFKYTYLYKICLCDL